MNQIARIILTIPKAAVVQSHNSDYRCGLETPITKIGIVASVMTVIPCRAPVIRIPFTTKVILISFSALFLSVSVIAFLIQILDILVLIYNEKIIFILYFIADKFLSIKI